MTVNTAGARPDAPSPSPRALLGGLAPASFLRRHWHKEPRLVRGAIPGFAGLATRTDLRTLAQRDDVESRLLVRDGGRWSLSHGPFRRADWKALPARDWTLLVQGVNLHLPAADRLLRRFSFVPWARLDDLMVSDAAPGGGVGPHFDSYDVFLLQGNGRRRWRYGRQDDLSLKPGLAVKILRRFAPSGDSVLGPGDMLYLPPQYAHDGVAVDDCTTWSIGLRAPAATELAQAFLDHLRDTVELPGRYADPDLKPTAEPARIDGAMQRRVATMLAAIRWRQDDVARFLGAWLSEPKPSVFFTPPESPLARAAFARRVARSGAALDARTQMLFDDAHLFVNGEALAWPEGGRAELERLANRRTLAPDDAAAIPGDTLALLHDWYRDGWLHPASA
mgnify:FL=1